MLGTLAQSALENRPVLDASGSLMALIIGIESLAGLCCVDQYAQRVALRFDCVCNFLLPPLQARTEIPLVWATELW